MFCWDVCLKKYLRYFLKVRNRFTYSYWISYYSWNVYINLSQFIFKIKTEKQVNISRELMTELEQISDKQEELSQELSLLKKLRKKDKIVLDETSESLAHIKHQ